MPAGIKRCIGGQDQPSRILTAACRLCTHVHAHILTYAAHMHKQTHTRTQVHSHTHICTRTLTCVHMGALDRQPSMHVICHHFFSAMQSYPTATTAPQPLYAAQPHSHMPTCTSHLTACPHPPFVRECADVLAQQRSSKCRCLHTCALEGANIPSNATSAPGGRATGCCLG